MADAPQTRTKRLGHRADAPVPTSTYRLQLTEDFAFADAAARLDYFASLGVSHLYLSPILTAAPGSTHFYDVVDHSRIADVLGGEEGLRDLAWRAGERGIGLVADLVPNHMAVPTPAYHNRALWSVLAEGADSPFAHWFDVDWDSGDPVLMPVLGERLGSILSSEQLTLDRMVVPGFEDQGEVPVLRYYEHVFPVKTGTENLPMASLVGEQNYRLAYWRVGNEELNYRRFFDVGSLVAVRVEDADVFDATHRVIVDLVKDGTLAGLRIDHPDGLANPAGYIERLSEATDGAWIVVEKILEDEETLPTSWKTAGTTGYDAMWRVGALLRDPAGAAPLAGTLYRLTGDALGSLPQLIQDAKREIVRESLSSEVHRLTNLAHRVCTADVRLRDHTWRALYDCLRRLLVAFERYRAYVVPGVQPKPMSLDAIDHAADKARALLDPERHETLDVVVDLLKGREVGSAGRTEDATRAELITRFQQACGAVMAKGVEDTAYYRWTHLLPLCEVGSPAARFAMPPAGFHAWAGEQQLTFPHAMTTLTTHDTKRSEDVRARLGILSEVPDDWDALVAALREASTSMRPQQLDGRMENLWWQILVGTGDEDGPMEWERLSGYLTKAMREAKTHTTWTSVNEEYEDAVQGFAWATHGDETIRALLARWHHDTVEGVRAAVLGQKLIQLTMPGVPDVYQGNETLAPSLVDPDNRRPVDYDAREEALARLDKGGRARTLADEKLLVTASALRARRDHADAMVGPDAGYQALPSSSGHAVVFARTVADVPRVITVATRVALELEHLGGWGETTVQLPEGRWHDLIGRADHEGGTVHLATLLKSHPVALLVPA
ncbi:malto-oligosyltrehalose synthase [Demequina sp. NBRC 110052]|uniref:malto-oligosyltrehalose synthase n=1 Tax=Demequina sp. NBRC 110052 TaxID=1570341 RepID=UPI0009FFA574|nr:malto-oligosyltrehalose synthase [Demequina sp. NBRC 110052]